MNDRKNLGARFSVSVVRLFILCGLFVASSVWSDNETRLREGGNASSIRLVGTDDTGSGSKVFIVQLRSPSAAEHFSKFTGSFTAKGLSTPQTFDKNNAAVQAYTADLTVMQDKVLARSGSGTEKIYSYRYTLNGFAARMTEAQAHKIEHFDEVLRVWEDEIRPLATNYSPQFLELFEPTVGLRGTPGLDGDGVIIAVIDSGITPEHPALKDTREADRPRLCQTSWAESSLIGLWLCKAYKQQEDKLLYDPPENWNGECQSGEQFEATACNNKLIGARYFIDGAQATGPIDSGELFSARDTDGHGTHTATTAAGSRVNASIFGTLLGAVEGIAPRARVSVYKACWLRPGDLRASCNTSDLANAIDMAVADGVHIINYSVGSSLRTATAPDDIALMAAAKAGILAAVAAGNEGPNLGTIGSPAGAPWVITAAASSRDGQRFEEALEVLTPPTIAGKYAVKEASFTPALIDNDPVEGLLVLVDDNDDTLDDGGAGTPFDACEPLVNGSDVSGNIAFIQRGGCSFEIKIANAEDAGAIAALVFNIAGKPIVMTGTQGFSNIPALMIGQADGNLILDEINADQAVNLVLDKSFFLTEQETGNIMGAFSARGPAPVQDILKPDVTAPGINILAGFTPDAANSVAGENFAYITGTSMATPHVAGVAALLRHAHPDWSPAMIKSALMTTARQDVNQQDGTTPANPFDFGSGHIVPNDANDPGLVYDVTDDEYDAFACGTASPAVDQVRCDDLAAGGLSFGSEDLNQPSITVSRLANSQTVSRRVTNVGDEAETYVASVSSPIETTVNVVPSSLTIGPGQSATFDVTFTYASGPFDLWRFGSLTWSSSNHDVRSVLAVRPVSVTAPAEVSSFGGSGNISFPVEFGYTGSYTPGVHGLRKPLVVNGFVDEDPSKTFTFRSTNGVTAHLIDVPADQAYLRFETYDELTDGDDDLDMYIYYCPDNINCTKIGQSGEPTSREQFNVLLPGAGRYAVLIHGFETDNVAGGPGANYTLLGWAFGLIDDQGNMTATGPGFVNAGTTEKVDVNWSGLESDTIYLGGISHNTPQGLVAITVIRVQN
jgi:subtilisin family serine protease